MNLTIRKPMTYEDFYREVESFFSPSDKLLLKEIYFHIEDYPENKKEIIVDLIKIKPAEYLAYAIGKNDI